MPDLTSWPAKILTPSRFDCESRPFREEPRPSCAPSTHPPSSPGRTRARPSRLSAWRARARTRARPPLRAVPLGRGRRDLRHGQVGVPLGGATGRRGRGVACRLCLRRGCLALRRRFPGADLLDLDAREPGAEAGVAPVALLGLVLADADLVAELVADDARGHRNAFRREASAVPSPPTNRTFGWNMLPSSCASRSTSRYSPSRTRYCFPPMDTIA